jgi:putative glutathione S-transferase
VRFDEVYVVHFKCAKKCIREYKNLPMWLRDVYQTGKLGPVVDMHHIRQHYYRSHRGINTFGIVPIAVGFDLDAPHGRAERTYVPAPEGSAAAAVPVIAKSSA